MDQSFCPQNSTENYQKSTSTKNFEAIVNFIPEIVGHTKLIFFIFQFFPHKLTNRMNSNFYRLKLFIFCMAKSKRQRHVIYIINIFHFSTKREQ